MPSRPPRDEFALVEALFAPLAAGDAGALGLRDDAALIEPRPDCTLVATADMLVGGVHFLPDDPPDLIARKLLRVNLSDLAAMGARPRGYLLSLALPDEIEGGWIDRFAAGIGEDQALHGISLLGGDTTATPGPACLCVTAFGEVEAGTALLRSGARGGDDVYVSGTIGDAALGLRVLRGPDAGRDAAHRAYLIDRYRLPRPRLRLGARLRGLATAAADISDGLAADLGHICKASALGAEIEAGAVPLSPAAVAADPEDPSTMSLILTGGDDYELIFTVAPSRAGEVRALAGELAIPLTRIGRMRTGEGVRVLDKDARPLVLPRTGYRHFAVSPRR